MKSKLLMLLAFCYATNTFSQTDGWYIFSKATEITKIIPDDTNANEIHLATDFGYIKYNTDTDMVVDFLNLTSQNPAIGTVNDIALDPTSNDIALTLKDGIAIYSGSAVTVYNYTSSGLTIGESTNQFIDLKVDYAKDGSLYIYKPDAFGYQKFNNGSFETETTTAFRPQDIAENSDGTKAYFAGDNNGLWELDKATDTWSNYTSSNSDLFQNFLTSLAFDSSDNLYMGNYQGLDRLDTSGNFTTCNDSTPIPVFDININPINGSVLTTNSQVNGTMLGVSVVDFDTCSWTKYQQDGTNCLNENAISACNYDSVGEIFAAPIDFSDPGRVIRFNPGNFCAPIDIDYIDVPMATNTNTIGDFAIRQTQSGDVQIGAIRNDKVHMLEFELGVGNNYAGFITVNTSENNWSIISDNDYFITENDTGWNFIDGNNVVAEFDHNIANHSAFITKKAGTYDSDDGIINLIHKGFDGAFNYRVYKTQCNTLMGTCSASEEIFTNDRDVSQDIRFGASEDKATGNVAIVGLKTNSSGQLARAAIHAEPNQPAVNNWDRTHDVFPRFDPIIFSFILDDLTTMFVPDDDSIKIISENNDDSSIVEENIDDSIVGFEITLATDHSTTITTEQANDIGVVLVCTILLGLNENSLDRVTFREVKPSANTSRTFNGARELGNELNDTQFNNPPRDLFIGKMSLIQYNSSEILLALLTNYGLLVKSGIDVSQFTLSNTDFELRKKDFTLFPNPSDDIVSFSNKNIDSANVHDLNGRSVLTVESNTFSIKNLNTGVYVVKAKLENGVVITRKLIKN